MTNPTPLTPAELAAAAYFAVGVTSEGSIGGRDVSYSLSFAGNVQRGGLMAPVGNSGYSFGTLQIDLGQHPDVARDLMAGYQQWAAQQPDHAALTLSARELSSTVTALQRTGHEMEAAGAHDIDRARINRFLGSDAGKEFIHSLDTQHVNGVTAVDRVVGNHDSALERLQRTALYRNADDQDQARLAGVFMKLQNQSGQARTPGLLTRVESGQLDSVADVKTAINGLLRNAANGNPDYIESGADNTLRGIGVFNALRAASRDNPLSAAWAGVVANPLVGPVAAHAADACTPAAGAQYDTVRSLFLTPEGAQRMIRALDAGTHLSEGNPALHHGRRGAGFYVAGHDFVHWNASGQGAACINGQWRSVDPDHLSRVVNRDGTVDLKLTENGQTSTLLHVDPRARALGQVPVTPGAEHHTGIAPPQPTGRAARADEPGHPDFDTFNRIHQWVSGTGHWQESQSRNIAAALYKEQLADPLLLRVDRVTGGRGRDGAENVFAVYAPHGDKGPHFHVQVDGRTAAEQPAAASLEQAERFAQRALQEPAPTSRAQSPQMPSTA